MRPVDPVTFCPLHSRYCSESLSWYFKSKWNNMLLPIVTLQSTCTQAYLKSYKTIMINVHLLLSLTTEVCKILHLLASQKFNLPHQRRLQGANCYLEMLILTYRIKSGTKFKVLPLYVLRSIVCNSTSRDI